MYRDTQNNSGIVSVALDNKTETSSLLSVHVSLFLVLYCPRKPSRNTPELPTGLTVWWCWCYLTRESQRFENAHCATPSVLKSGIFSHTGYRTHIHVCLFCFELPSSDKDKKTKLSLFYIK